MFVLIPKKGEIDMDTIVIKGYLVPEGYIGFIGATKKMLFDSEEEYLEYLEDPQEETKI